MDGNSHARDLLEKFAPVKIIDGKEIKPSNMGTRKIIPERLLKIPGVVSKHAEYTNSSTPYPNTATSFCGALAFLSFAAGRRYRMADNTRPNIYIVCVANSGAGKDAPRKTNGELARSCGVSTNVADSIASGEGLEDMIMDKAKVLVQNDEMDTLFRAIAEDRSGGKETIIKNMLTAFSSAGGYMTKRRKSMSGDKHNSGPTATFCIHPHLTVYGSAVPNFFYSSLNERTLSNGLMARCMIVDCGIRGKRNKECNFKEPPADLVTVYRSILGTSVDPADGYARIADKAEVANNDMTIVSIAPDAKEVLNDCEERWDKLYHACDNAADSFMEAEQSFRARTAEHVAKMSMLYAISENPSFPIITKAAVKWAVDFVEYCQGSMISSIHLYCSQNDFDALMKRVMRMFERRRKLTQRDISRGLREPTSTVKDVIEAMIANGDIEEIDESTGVFYYLSRQ